MLSFSITVSCASLAGAQQEHLSMWHPPIGNAAGTVKTVEDVEALCCVPDVFTIILGSITVEPRAGNPSPNFWHEHDKTANSLGLNNGGISYYEKHLPIMVKLCADHGKELIVSVAGFSPQEYQTLVDFCRSFGIRVIELNFGCPNVWGESGQKPIVSEHPRLMRDILELLRPGNGLITRNLWVKLSPLMPGLLTEIVEVLVLFPNIRGVVASNTFPNGFALDEDGKPAIFGKNLGGIAGAGLLEIAAGQVAQLRELLPVELHTKGAGGIYNGRGMYTHVKAGALGGVQVGSHFYRYGPRVFGEILTEYAELVDRWGDPRNR